MRYLSAGERDLWNEMQRDGAPEYQCLRNSKHKARKDHTCSICKQTIKAGETYIKHVYTLDGEFIADKEHDICPDAFKHGYY